MNDEFSAVDVSKANETTSEPEAGLYSGMNLGDSRLLPRWCPAYRQHEPGPGSRVEHVKARPETAGQHSKRLSAGRREGELQAAESVRGRVPVPDAPADSPVVAVIRPRIAVGWGAKGRGRPGERM